MRGKSVEARTLTVKAILETKPYFIITSHTSTTSTSPTQPSNHLTLRVASVSPLYSSCHPLVHFRSLHKHITSGHISSISCPNTAKV
ncbi:hypothetical protein BLNAU_5536 [Blattamonas nauphoetae]|uniref:Uncharacterized protein n=1 Tax=Blattamonas nauphoetae TaxID=2049346 RepID=A0ABQ9Y6U1_9EUKA|nr:hypothetical protein BLNAU_5536 [Blattamonas nauphoetae]